VCSLRLGALSNILVHVRPAPIDTGSVLFDDESKRGVMKFDQRSAIDFAQAVLHVVDDGIRHEQRAAEL
jgi:hypothetical protein